MGAEPGGEVVGRDTDGAAEAVMPQGVLPGAQGSSQRPFAQPCDRGRVGQPQQLQVAHGYGPNTQPAFGRGLVERQVTRPALVGSIAGRPVAGFGAPFPILTFRVTVTVTVTSKR